MNPADHSPLWIRGARVIDPSAKRDEAKGDVFALDGLIVEKLSAADQAKARIIDGQGLVVAPGFVDLNCRLGEPGRSARETVRSGTRAAAAGGFTTLVAMPDSLPAADNVGTLQLLREICSRDASVRVLPTGTLTKGHEGKALAPLGSMKKAGVVAVTDTTSGVQNNEIMRRALEYAAMFDLVVLDHCQDSSMTEGAQMHEGAWSLRLGVRGWPRAAEEIVASSDCLLAELTKARIHLQHLSSGGSAEIVRRAKAKKLAVTSEVSALHLLLTDASLANYPTSLKTNPPLRDLAPFGAATLETAFAAAHTAVVAGGHADLALLLARLTCGPAKALGLAAGTLRAGAAADLVLLDPKAAWKPVAADLYSNSGNNPLLGHALTGRIQATFVGARQVHGA